MCLTAESPVYAPLHFYILWTALQRVLPLLHKCIPTETYKIVLYYLHFLYMNTLSLPR